ncbi:hypothetical protein [Limibacillus sp. MBR-115]|uniref:hypothetical protein n=1 Tax=Limibacillus sp. MBR-115 TaxID=3156465 RepID=UPI003392C13E
MTELQPQPAPESGSYRAQIDRMLRLGIRKFARLEIPCHNPDQYSRISQDLQELSTRLLLIYRDTGLDAIGKAQRAQSEIRATNRLWIEKYQQPE